jgi:hypothetical protein
MPSRFLVLLLAAPLLAGCGGNDKSKVESTVRSFVKATNDRDADKWCNDLTTKDFKEQATGATGGEATDACKRQLKSLKRPSVTLLRIDKVKIDGDRATASTTIDAQGQRAPQAFRLQKEGGDWRISGGG